MVETVFTLIICGLVAYIMIRDGNKPPSQRRRASALPRQQAPQAQPVGALLGTAIRNDLRRLRRFCSDLWQHARGHGSPIAMSSGNGSVSPDLTYIPLVLPSNQEPRTEPVPRTEAELPPYVIPDKRIEALERAFQAGLDSAAIKLIQAGDATTIRRAMSLESPVPAGVLASIMGGTRADRLREIKAIAEQSNN